MLKKIPEKTLEMDEEWYTCLIDWHEESDCIKWTKLMQILKETGIDSCTRKLISELHGSEC